MTRCALFIVSLLFSGYAYSFDILEVVPGEPFPLDPGAATKRLTDILPTDNIKVSNSGILKHIFSDYEIRVLSEKRRRVAIVLASRVFLNASDCEHTKSKLRASITEKLGNADFPYSNTVESDPPDATEYVFSCSTPGGSPYTLLNFIVRNGEMGKEVQKISYDKLQRFNNRIE